ncbi:MAG TPA: GAF domain-containing protein [Thermoflexia bacterium]|jgi:PAS domain S-box-containing protein|nr:GAF domain-containing protein [Thermoflexia bacterium]
MDEWTREWVTRLIPLGVLVTDANLVVQLWNQWLEEHSGQAAREVIGRSLLELYPELVDRGLDRIYRDVLEGYARVLSHRLHRYLIPLTCRSLHGEERMMQSAQILPLIREEQVVGTLTFIEDVTERVRYEERLVAEMQQARRHAERLALVNRIAGAVSAVLEMDELLETVYVGIASTLPVDAFFVALYDEERQEVDYRFRIDQGIREPPERRPLGSGFTSVVLTTGRPLLIRNFEQEKDRLPTPRLWGTGEMPDSWLGVPMRLGGQVIGAISVQAYRPEAYGPEDELFLSIIADQVAIAVENARLFAEEREQRQRAEALAAAAAAIGSTLDLEEVLDRILEELERAIAGDAYSVMVVEGEEARVVRHRGYERLELVDHISRLVIPLKRYPLLQRMQRTGKPVVIPDTLSSPDWVRAPDKEWRRSYVGAPIRVGKRTIGFLNVNSTEPGRLGPADAQWLQAFASQVAIALENARLYQELQAYASELEERVAERTAELEAHYAQLDAILRSALDGIVVTDRDGRIIQTNPVAEQWLNNTPPEEAARLRETIIELAREAGTRPQRLVELSGAALEVKASPVKGGKPDGAWAVVVLHDVSHLKALDRMRSRFITNISHEFRTPLATAKLYATQIRKNPEQALKLLEPLEQELDHLSRLLEDILKVAQLDGEGIKRPFKEVSLNLLAAAIADGRHMLAKSHGLTLTCHLAETDPLVLGDWGSLTEALDQLVCNGIQYTPEGGKITIQVATVERKGRRWGTISVSDTGIGIPEEELPHVFERFFRGEEPRRKQVSGTGLGLALAQQIVSLHGGWIAVESQVGEGSTFTIWLPLASDVSEAA